MPRLVVISDTHSFFDGIADLPDGDILIHAGDITRKGDLVDLQKFAEWMDILPHKNKIVIAGNHDFCFERTPDESKKILSNVIYLEDQWCVVEGIKFYGSPWQPRFFDWAFNADRGEEIAKIWSKIPNDTDVLITHGPPFGILDCNAKGRHVGCQDLLMKVRDISIKAHLFGHIHEGYGVQVVDGKKFINASICDLKYQPINQPIILDI